MTTHSDIKTSQDISAQAKGPDAPRGTRRAARFVSKRNAPVDAHVTPTMPLVEREALYSPAHATFDVQEVLDGLSSSLEHQLQLTQDPADVRWRVSALARIAEARGDAERSILVMNQLRRAHDFNAQDWQAMRRAHRTLHQSDLVERTLEQSAKDEDPVTRSLAQLEHAQWAWMQEEPSERVVLMCEREPLTHEDANLVGFVETWRRQLILDAQLADGDVEAALASIDDLLDDVSLPTNIETSMRMMQALWYGACGKHDRAETLLSALVARGAALGDEDACVAMDVLSFLKFAKGQRAELGAQLSKVSSWQPDRPWTASMCALLAHVAAQTSPAEAATLLRRNLERLDQDEVLLDVYVELLERMCAREPEQPSWPQELVRALNMRLNVTTAPEARAELLFRLGQLYELHVGDDVAAIEVLSEALTVVDDHPPTFRALGKLYSRRSAWRELAALYEREIDVLAGSDEVWRRHFQVAKIYERDLQNEGRALTHYRKVLSLRPYDIPSIKACARLLERAQRWADLADMFLASVPKARTTRQRLYLLEKVAQVAEKHLGHSEVAIGAWEEIMTLEGAHLGVFSSLGRLYSRTQSWGKLVELNEREMICMDDKEELAGMHVRNATLRLAHLDQAEDAEADFRAALMLIPTYLPALEGLGSMLVQAQRWDDLIRMSTAEFSAISDTREQVRQLTSLAQTCELQLERPADAIKLYRAALQRDPDNTHAWSALVRLYQRGEHWASLLKLQGFRADRTLDAHERAELLEAMGRVLEWSMAQPAQAFERYRAALALDAHRTHALHGMMRTWSDAGQQPNQVVAWLEESCELAKNPEAIHAHCVGIARLIEFASQIPEASAQWRAKDPKPSREHALIRRLTLGLFADRQVMQTLRSEQPLHAWEFVSCVERTSAGQGAILAKAWRMLPTHARAVMVGEFTPDVTASLSAFGVEDLSSDVCALLEGQSLPEPSQENPTLHQGARLRMRALMSRDNLDTAGYVQWTGREMGFMSSRALRTQRLLEWYGLCAQDSVLAKSVLVRAAECAFPELQNQAPMGTFDGPVMDLLYDALHSSHMWALLRCCLDAHVVRPDLGSIRRVYLYDMLADVLEGCLEDLDSALEAKIHAWELSSDVPHLHTIVRICRELGYTEQALGYQHELYEATVQRSELPVAERVAQGMALVDLLFEQEDSSIDDAMMMLDILLEDYSEDPCSDMIRLKMAHAQTLHGSARQAARLFEQALNVEHVADNIDDWMVYVELVADKLNDTAQAYALQWNIVRAAPKNLGHLDMLLELADDCGLLKSCADDLVVLADERGPVSQRVLLKSAALLYEEHLGDMESAANVYERLSVIASNDGDRRDLRRKQASCLTRVLGQHQRALEIYRTLTGDDPFDAVAFEGMGKLLSSVQTMDRARVVHQVLRTLGQEIDVEVSRAKTIPSRVLDEVDEVECLLPKNLSLPLFDAFSLASSFIDRQWEDDLPSKSQLDHDKRLAKQWEPVSDLFAIMFDAIGIKRMRTMFGENLTAPFEIVWDKEVNIWLNVNTIERMSEPELRYLAAYCAALVWTDMPGIRHLDGRNIWSLFNAVHVITQQAPLVEGQEIDDRTAELARSIAGARHTVMRRRVGAAVVDAFEVLSSCDGSSWRRDIETFAHKFAAAVCGDVSSAVNCVLKMEGWKFPIEHEKTQVHIRKHALCETVIRFALSEDYLTMRYALGLSGRPSTM